MDTRKVTVKVIQPPSSPSPSQTFRPKAKVNTIARKPTAKRPVSPTKQQLTRPRAQVVLSDDDSSSPRITSKLSRLAKQASPTDQPRAQVTPTFSDDDSRITSKLSTKQAQPSLLPTASLRARTQRPRVPSISSAVSSSSSALYQGNRPTTAPGKYFYGGARVDPATIPLPSQSPPTSTISFSSRSSLSGAASSSGGHLTESGTSPARVNPPVHARRASTDVNANVRSGLENLMNLVESVREQEDYSEDEPPPDEEQLSASTAERKVRAEAKSVRKIADLEITNRSLLAINTTLEQTRHRQAKELRELRRKLRESRLILPPRAFRAVKSSLDHDDTADEDEEAGEEDGEEEENDATYRRVKSLLDGLLESGRRALETTPRDFPEPPKVAKVLSAYELLQLSDDEPPPASVRASPNPTNIAVPDSSDSEGGFASEVEVEAMTLRWDSPYPSNSPSPVPAPSHNLL